MINTIKSKHYSWNNQLDPTLQQTSGNVIKKYRNARRASSADFSKMAEIMDSIESFRSN